MNDMNYNQNTHELRVVIQLCINHKFSVFRVQNPSQKYWNVHITCINFYETSWTQMFSKDQNTKTM